MPEALRRFRTRWPGVGGASTRHPRAAGPNRRARPPELRARPPSADVLLRHHCHSTRPPVREGRPSASASTLATVLLLPLRELGTVRRSILALAMTLASDLLALPWRRKCRRLGRDKTCRHRAEHDGDADQNAFDAHSSPPSPWHDPSFMPAPPECTKKLPHVESPVSSGQIIRVRRFVGVTVSDLRGHAIQALVRAPAGVARRTSTRSLTCERAAAGISSWRCRRRR